MDQAQFLRSLFGLDGRVAVVTGGASGLGAAFSRGFAAAGATVVIGDIDAEGALVVVDEIEQAGGAADYFRLDVTSVQQVNEFVDLVSERHGRIDVLLNSAGAAHRCPVVDFPEAAYDRIMALNLKGTYFMGQAVGRKMLAQGSGSIINVASIGGFNAYPDASAYLASKGGVVQLTRSFALEFAAGGVRVNAIAPGLCDSPILTKAIAQSGGSTTTVDFIENRQIVHRLIRPDELVAAALFLAGDGSAKVTGHSLPVDDGYLAV